MLDLSALLVGPLLYEKMHVIASMSKFETNFNHFSKAQLIVVVPTIKKTGSPDIRKNENNR